MQVSFTSNAFPTSVTNGVVNGFAKMQAYRTLLGKVMAQREGLYFAVFGTTSDQVSDPQGRLDKRQRAIITAVADGFSEATAKLSRQEFLPIVLNGAVTLSSNPIFGLVQSYRDETSRLYHGLKANLSDRKSGRKRRKPRKKIAFWSRRYQEV